MRTSRPLPDSVCFSLTKFSQIWIIDGSTLEALFRKLDSLKDIPTGKLAGKMAIDLGDAVASELSLPFDSISIEMIYRGLYHFIVAYNKGKAKDPVKYFSAPENRDLGIIKRQRKPRMKLIIAPFPDKGKNQNNFFFENPLTPCFSP